jgi:hypothetical protein
MFCFIGGILFAAAIVYIPFDRYIGPRAALLEAANRLNAERAVSTDPQMMSSAPESGGRPASSVRIGDNWATDSRSAISLPNACALATIDNKTHTIEVDWKCVEKTAGYYDGTGKGQQLSAWAMILLAVRDGTAKAVDR